MVQLKKIKNHLVLILQPPECNNATLMAMYWGSIDSCIQWYKDNTLLVEAYYERLNYQTTTQNADYTVRLKF